MRMTVSPVPRLSVSGQGYWQKHDANLTFAKQVLADPATLRTLYALSVHPYARSHWIPTTNMPWGKASWVMPNETGAFHLCVRFPVTILR